MAVEFRGPVICIRQLQGVAGYKVPENLMRWPALFVEGIKTFLLNSPEISSARLYSAHTRVSYEYPTSDVPAADFDKYQQNLRRRYDGTARQCGFKKEHRDYWAWDVSMREHPVVNGGL
jgi:hypothetical protein